LDQHNSSGFSARGSTARGRDTLPEPETVFLEWLVSRRPEADLAAAARFELHRLESFGKPHRGVERLAKLFTELVNELEDHRNFAHG